MASQSSAQPESSMRIGSVKGAIWQNTSNDRSFYSLNLVRSYQDGNGNWVDTSSFGVTEVLAAQKILEKAIEQMVELTNTV